MVHCERGLLSAVTVLLVMAEVGHSLDVKMELAFVVYRHGDRSPQRAYPNDKYQEDFWPQGFGQLSITGMQQEYFLGEILKKRYTSTNGFIYPNYTRVEVHIRSTDTDRTLMSAETQLAGLYPPQDDQKFNSSIDWQPIPVHTVPRSQDNLLRAFLNVDCPTYKELRSQDPETQTYKDIEEENQEFFQLLEENTGYENVDLGNIYFLYDALLIEQIHGLEQPSWVTPDVMTRLSDLEHYTLVLFFDSKEKQRLSAGVWLKEVLDNINEKTANPEQDMKLFLYSGHDTTLVCMMTALDVWNELSVPYGSAFFVELYSDSGRNYFVSLFYRNETDSEDVIPLHVEACVNTTFCTLHEFSELLLGIIPDDWERECGLYSEDSNESSDDTVNKGQYIAAAVLAGVFALLVIILAVVIAAMCCLQYRKS